MAHYKSTIWEEETDEKLFSWKKTTKKQSQQNTYRRFGDDFILMISLESFVLSEKWKKGNVSTQLRYHYILLHKDERSVEKQYQHKYWSIRWMLTIDTERLYKSITAMHIKMKYLADQSKPKNLWLTIWNLWRT